MCNNLCNIHKQMLMYKLIPMSPQFAICMNCLKKNIKGFSDPMTPVCPIEYNYIFPMICDSCAHSLKRCKWCRISRKKVLP
jgi:hypothetical protein